MNNQEAYKSPSEDELFTILFKEHGPLISGADLWRIMGFKSADAFRQAKAQNRLEVSVFSVANRRGTFAYTMDVWVWLTNLSGRRYVIS